MPLIGNVKAIVKSLTKSVLIPLGFPVAAAAATDAAIYKEIFGSGNTTLNISNEEMNDIMKIVKLLEVTGLLIKGVCKAIKNEGKKQKRGFLGMLLETVRASLLGNPVIGKNTITAG